MTGQWGRPSLFVVCLFQAGNRSRRQKTIVCSTNVYAPICRFGRLRGQEKDDLIAYLKTL
jgi:hypothetical protein